MRLALVCLVLLLAAPSDAGRRRSWNVYFPPAAEERVDANGQEIPFRVEVADRRGFGWRDLGTIQQGHCLHVDQKMTGGVTAYWMRSCWSDLANTDPNACSETARYLDEGEPVPVCLGLH